MHWLSITRWEVTNSRHSLRNVRLIGRQGSAYLNAENTCHVHLPEYRGANCKSTKDSAPYRLIHPPQRTSFDERPDRSACHRHQHNLSTNPSPTIKVIENGKGSRISVRIDRLSPGKGPLRGWKERRDTKNLTISCSTAPVPARSSLRPPRLRRRVRTGPPSIENFDAELD